MLYIYICMYLCKYSLLLIYCSVSNLNRFLEETKITLEIHGPDQINNKNLNVICFLILA